MADINTDLWLELLDYARWAPSPHNIQPWKVKIISDTEADIYYLPNRLLPDTDPTGRFTVAGFGMLIECISVAAHAKGLNLIEKYDGAMLDHKQTEPTLFIHLVLSPGWTGKDFNPKLIEERRTSRLPYNGEPVGEHILGELKKIASEYGHNLTTTSDSDLVQWIVLLNRDTLFYDMADSKSRNEVGHWLRFTSGQAHAHNDGLWAYCMRFPALLMYLFFKQEWFFELPIVKQITQAYYLTTMRGTRTAAWLQGPFSNSIEWLKAGHMVMRLWLAMTERGVYLHPFGSIITNDRAHARLREKFKANESKDVLWLIMRLGYSEEPPRSLRLPLEEIMLT